MRATRRPLTYVILSTCFVLLLTACGINNPAFLSGGDAAVSITLTGASTVMLGGQSQYAATVTGGTNSTVTWSVNGVAGGSSAAGSISAQGLYVAPASAPQSPNVTITATSAATPTVSKSLPVVLATPAKTTSEAPVAVALDGATTVTLGTSSQYVAAVAGSTNTAVTWSVNGVAGGNTTVGSISATGLYSAPSTEPQTSKVTITATSVADSSVSQSLAVALAAPPAPPTGGSGGGETPVTLALSGATTVTLGTSSQYVATVTGNSDTKVMWSVDGIVGGDTTVGAISTKGRYTAPKSKPQSAKITITATSMADTSVSQSLAVTLASPVTSPQGGTTVTVTLSGATSVTLGSSSQYTATVTGSTNTGVTWSVDGVNGGDASVGTISAKGSFSSPASEPPSSKVTITATSLADSSVSQNLVVMLAAPPPPPTPGLTLSGATSVTLGTTSQYTAKMTGSTNTAVNWSVNGVAGGNAADGTISTSGLYSAPSTAPQTSTVTIAATSAAVSTVAKSIVVTLVAPSSNSRIPANAIVSGDLDASNNWEWKHDPGTPGSSQGSTVYPVAGMSGDNVAREFYMTYSAGGGEIYHVSFATDKTATHFVYDAHVYVENPSQLANLEMDMNDVMADGRTVILATQCSSYSGSWEYTLYSGGFHWHPSNIPCNPKNWSANTWHHIQIATERDGNGNATYDWVSVDGQYSDFQNASGPDAENLSWAIGTLLINFQIDGLSKGSGSDTLYTDQLKVYRW
ncbi:MAG: hypothetical protein WCB58_19895 [Acidobacteriaceae bacterium]